MGAGRDISVVPVERVHMISPVGLALPLAGGQNSQPFPVVSILAWIEHSKYGMLMASTANQESGVTPLRSRSMGMGYRVRERPLEAFGTEAGPREAMGFPRDVERVSCFGMFFP